MVLTQSLQHCLILSPVSKSITKFLDDYSIYTNAGSFPIDHETRSVLAFVFGKRKDIIFRKLKALLKPFGISRFNTDDWVHISEILQVSSMSSAKETHNE